MQFRHLLVLFALLFLGAAKKPQVTVRFHTLANPRDGASFAMPVTLSNPPRTVYIKKVPELSERDVAAIYPFPAPDGTMGCAFKLDSHGAIGLDTLSIESRGSVLVCVVSHRVVTAMLIDRRVSDGIISIPSGLAKEEIALLQKQFRTLGAPKTAKP